MDALYLSSCLWAALFLAAASVMDLRSREVSDRVWWAIMPAMVPVLLSRGTPDAGTLSAVLSSAVLLAFFLCGEGRRGHAMAAASVLLWACGAAAGASIHYLLVPVFQVLFYLAYLAGLVPGGADAKCLMTVAAVFPFYPAGAGIVGTVLPPAVSALFLATVLTTVSYAVWLIVFRKGLREFPYVRTDIAEARGSFAWILEDFRDGEVVRCGDGGEEALTRLEEAGREDVLVSPMIPFIVPLAAGTVATLVLGCPFTCC